MQKMYKVCPCIEMLGLHLAGLILKATASCIVAVRQRVASYKEGGFGRDNKESITQLFASFFIKVLTHHKPYCTIESCELYEPSSVHIGTGDLCLSLCLALGACGAVTGSGEFVGTRPLC
jgi:hypothetical protein